MNHRAAKEPAWVRDDRKWFDAHPDRRFRLRRPWPGEAAASPGGPPPADGRLAILVFQPEGGIRLRLGVHYAHADPLDSWTDAGIEKLLPDGVGFARSQVATLAALRRQATVAEFLAMRAGGKR